MLHVGVRRRLLRLLASRAVSVGRRVRRINGPEFRLTATADYRESRRPWKIAKSRRTGNRTAAEKLGIGVDHAEGAE